MQVSSCSDTGSIRDEPYLYEEHYKPDRTIRYKKRQLNLDYILTVATHAITKRSALLNWQRYQVHIKNNLKGHGDKYELHYNSNNLCTFPNLISFLGGCNFTTKLSSVILEGIIIGDSKNKIYLQFKFYTLLAFSEILFV